MRGERGKGEGRGRAGGGREGGREGGRDGTSGNLARMPVWVRRAWMMRGERTQERVTLKIRCLMICGASLVRLGWS